MMELEGALRLQAARQLMAQGVTIHRPETCIIDADVTVGPDTIVEPFVQLLGKTQVGEDCRIRSYSVIQDSTIGDGVLVRNSCVLEQATIADAPSSDHSRICAPAARLAAKLTSATLSKPRMRGWVRNRRRII